MGSCSLTEPQWVTLRLAAQNTTAAPLAAVVRSRARVGGILDTLDS